MNRGWFWSGGLELELTSADLKGAFGRLTELGVELRQLQPVSDICCRFWISRKAYTFVKEMAEKQGEKVTICRYMGCYWRLRSLRRQKLLVLGIGALLGLTMYLPSRILFVEVEGNQRISNREILSAAEENGIKFGADRRAVRSEKVKNGILTLVPQLQWAGVNTFGCTAVISVRERPEEAETQHDPVSNVVALRDGYILSGTVTKGTPLFSVGQTVKQGQVLISGYTDCGLCIRAGRSEGEIFAQTSRNLTVVALSDCRIRGAGKPSARKFSLLIGKKRINLWKDSGISHSSCGRIYKEYYVPLPGGFQLPLALCVEEVTAYEMSRAEIPPEDDRLLEFTRQYLLEQMIAGSILDRDETIASDKGVQRLEGRYVCTEMIGREQPEKIGETNGKNS